MRKGKLGIFIVIMLLTFALFSAFNVTKVSGETWTDITLPYTISAPGNYRITAPWNTTTTQTGVIIQASDVVVDGQNYLLTGNGNGTAVSKYAPYSNILIQNINATSFSTGISAQYSSNFTVKDSSINQCLGGIYVVQCTDFTIENCTADFCPTIGVYTYNSSNFAVKNCHLTNNSISATYSHDFSVDGCSILNGYWGLFAPQTGNFSVTNMNCVGGHGLTADSSGNCTFEKITLTNSSSLSAYNSVNVTILDSAFDNNQFAAAFDSSIDVQVKKCLFTNTANQPFQAINVTNALVEENTFRNNKRFALLLQDSNCTIRNNVFDSNNESIYWEVTDNLTIHNSFFNNNVFRENNYTFTCFKTTMPASNTNQKLYFYNNLVNDTAFVNPIGYFAQSFNNGIFNFNTSKQTGSRIYSSGDFIGGNYWCHPDGSGYSQVGVDANGDGFVDLPFDVLEGHGAVAYYDYLPYSSGPQQIDHFVLSVPPSATVGASFTVTITAKDASGNTVTGFSGDVSLSANQGTVTPAVTGAFTDGFWTGQLTASNAGSLIVTASDGVHTGASSQITVNPAPTPTPTPTAAPTSTPKPTSTQTPAAASEPTPTATTQQPTSTPETSHTQTPSLTATPLPAYNGENTDDQNWLTAKPLSSKAQAATAASTAVAAAVATGTAVAFSSIGNASATTVSAWSLPNPIKDFIKDYAEAKFEKKLKKEKEAKQAASPTQVFPSEIAILAFSIVISAVVAAFVLAGGVGGLTDLGVFGGFLAAAALSACTIQGATFAVELFCSGSCGVKKRFSLWSVGSVMFLFTGLVFLFPFSSPVSTAFDRKVSTKTNGLAILLKELLLLGLTVLFGVLVISGFSICPQIGSAGILLIVANVCSQMVPLSPLPGRELFDYNKTLSLAMFVPLAILVFAFQLNLLPALAYALVGVVAFAFVPLVVRKIRSAEPAVCAAE